MKKPQNISFDVNYQCLWCSSIEQPNLRGTESARYALLIGDFIVELSLLDSSSNNKGIESPIRLSAYISV